MAKRKDQLKNLFGGGDEALIDALRDTQQENQMPQLVKEDETNSNVGHDDPTTIEKLEASDTQTNDENEAPVVTPIEGENVTERPKSGAVRAMGLSLQSLSKRAEEASALRESVANGEMIVEVSPDKIEASPYKDRISLADHDDLDFEALVESIRVHGQQVPVLLRPHPDAIKAGQGFYQAAFGHRRIEAARRCNIAVKALIRPLNDDDLVIAQGKENAERRDLTFIERALFAQALINGGFDRRTAQASLCVHKAEMTRFLQVAQAIPSHIARAIGPAPKVGRPRWMALGELLESKSADAKALDELSCAAFRAADSDQRFQRLFSRLSKQKPLPTKTSINVMGRGSIGHLQVKGKTAIFTLPDAGENGFAKYIADQLPDLFDEWKERKKETNEK